MATKGPLYLCSTACLAVMGRGEGSPLESRWASAKAKRTPKSAKQWSALLILLRGRSPTFLLPHMHMPHVPSKGATPQLGIQPRFLTICLVYTPGCLAGWISEKELQKGSNITWEKVPKIPDPISHQCYRKVCSINMVNQVIGCTLIHIDPWPSTSSSQRRRGAKDWNTTPKTWHMMSACQLHTFRFAPLLTSIGKMWIVVIPLCFLKTKDALGCLWEEIGHLFSFSMHEQEISVSPSLLAPNPWRESRTAVRTEGDHPSRGPDEDTFQPSMTSLAACPSLTESTAVWFLKYTTIIQDLPYLFI